MWVGLCANPLSNLFVIRFRIYFSSVRHFEHRRRKEQSLGRLVLLFVVSLRIDFGKFMSNMDEVTSERRGPPPNPVELAVGHSSLLT